MTTDHLIKVLSNYPKNSKIVLDNCNIHSFEISTITGGIGEDPNGYQIPLLIINITKV